MFYSIEGVDGAGCTTLTKELLHEVDNPLLTCEPYQYDPHGYEDTYETVLGFLHDRARHQREMIDPYTDEYTVVSDRSMDSTLAYQARDWQQYNDLDSLWQAAESLRELHEPWYTYPDITLYVSVSVDTAMERNDGIETRSELEDAKDVYDYLNEVEPRFVEIDGEQSKESVVEDAVNAIECNLA